MTRAGKTINPDAYSGSRPDKVEYHLSRMNLHSPDPALPIGGSAAPALTPGEIAAAVAMDPPRLGLTCRYVSRHDALQMLDALLFAKYAIDEQARSKLFYYLFANVLPGQLSESERDMSKLLTEIARARGILRRICEVAIDDVCKPQVYVGVSARGWAAKMGLSNHKQWQQTWQRRYERLLAVLQELDACIVAQIQNRI